MSIRDLAGDVKAPRASLAAGAVGIAYALGHIGSARDDAAIRATSRRWLAIARRAGKSRDGYRVEGWRRSTSSVMFGPLGLATVTALLAPSPRTVAPYIAATRRATSRAPAEYMFGLAGSVFAAIAVARASAPNDLAARALVRDLAARLAKRPPPPVGGFAHGDVGSAAARIAAARALGEPCDPAVVASLAAIEPPHVLARGGSLARSWCNGLAGYALAWVLAAEASGDERCRAHALAAGPHLLDELDAGGGSVCCGLGGRAYALLAIARLDPAGPWSDHARQLATRALAHTIPPGGLAQGLPGVMVLAHDLSTSATARFPFVDVA